MDYGNIDKSRSSVYKSINSRNWRLDLFNNKGLFAGTFPDLNGTGTPTKLLLFLHTILNEPELIEIIWNKI